MFNKEKVKGFIAGACTAAIITSVGAVFATNYDVYDGDIKVFWEGVQRKFYDANGKEVKPLIINDSTYVPLRGMGAVLGKTAEFVGGETKYVYIGGKNAKKTTSVVEMKEQKMIDNSYRSSIYEGKYATYQMKKDVINCENTMTISNEGFSIFVLDHKYTKFTCEAVLPYTQVGQANEGTLTFYSVENDGTQSIIDEPIELKQTEDAQKIEIDLGGVTNLKIEYKGNASLVLANSFFLGKK